MENTLKFDEKGNVIVPKNKIEDSKDRNLKLKKKGGIVKLNDLAIALGSMIEKLGSDINYKDMSTMRCFYNGPIKRGNGLCWLYPEKDGSLKIHISLKNKDYSGYDPKKIVFIDNYGNYPTIKINNFSELDYAFNLIKFAYNGK